MADLLAIIGQKEKSSMKRKECHKQIIDYTKGKKNRKKEECQKQIIDLMI